MKFKENRDRTGALRGYWDETGKACKLDAPFKLDTDGNPTEELRDDAEIILMADAEVDQVLVKVAEMEAQEAATQYQRDRVKEYPPITDYLDGVVKGNQTQIDTYIAACQAVKAKYPKPQN